MTERSSPSCSTAGLDADNRQETQVTDHPVHRGASSSYLLSLSEEVESGGTADRATTAAASALQLVNGGLRDHAPWRGFHLRSRSATLVEFRPEI